MTTLDGTGSGDVGYAPNSVTGEYQVITVQWLTSPSGNNAVSTITLNGSPMGVLASTASYGPITLYPNDVLGITVSGATADATVSAIINGYTTDTLPDPPLLPAFSAAASVTTSGGGSTGTPVSFFLSSNLSMNANTSNTVGSISLTAGTWLITGQALIEGASGQFVTLYASSTAGASGAYGGGQVETPSGDWVSVAFSCLVTVTSTTTVYLMASNQGSSAATLYAEASSVEGGGSVPGMTGIIATPV